MMATGEYRAGRVAGHLRHSCKGLKIMIVVLIFQGQRRAPGGGRTHTGRILRPQDHGYCGLYQRLCPHGVPHQPHQSTMVDVISCHEPCHAAADRCGSALLAGFAPAGKRAVSPALNEFHRVRVGEAKTSLPRARHGSDYPGGVLHLTTRTWRSPTSTGRCPRRIRVDHLKRAGPDQTGGRRSPMKRSGGAICQAANDGEVISPRPQVST
jgi:hypothetical protein